MHRKTRRIFTMALVLAMALAFLPVNALAAEGDTAEEPMVVANNIPITYGSINPGLPTLDSGWNAAPWIKVNKPSGSPAANFNTGASFKVLWDENYLYVMTQVFDTVLDNSAGPNYNQDSVEIFVDVLNNKTPATRGYANTDFQFRVSYTNVASFDHGGNERLISATRVTKDAENNDTGYIVESVFYIGDLRRLAGGMSLGFDVQINNGRGGNRQGQWFWYDGTGNQWQRPANFGAIVLSEKPAEVPARVDKLPLFQSIVKAQNANLAVYENGDIIAAPLAAAVDTYYNQPAATQDEVNVVKTALDAALFALNRPGEWPDPKRLADIPELPDLFTFMDGSRVASAEDWALRQEEISSLAQYYQYGKKRPVPEDMVATYTRSGNTLTGRLVYNGLTKTFTTAVTLPNRTTYPGLVPVMIGGSGTAYTNAGIATAGFNTGTWANEAQTTGIYYDFFPFIADDPDNDVSCIMAWAWGFSRVVDGLLSLKEDGTPLFPEINPAGICVTGFSINGKFALAAGAFDKRVAVTVPGNSGAGGVSNWRFLYNGKYYDPAVYNGNTFYPRWSINASAAPGGDTSAQGIYYESIKNTSGGHPGWYKRIFTEFIEAASDAPVRLPYDQHSIIALCASEGRSVMITGGFQDWGTNPQAMHVSYKAAKKAWEFLGDPHGIALTMDKGGHTTTSLETADIVAFINFRVNGIGSYAPLWETDPYVDYDESTNPWQAPPHALSVTASKGLVTKGEYFDVAAAFEEVTATNAATVTVTYDSSKFAYAGDLGVDGVTNVTTDASTGQVKLTLMIVGYDALNLVNLRFQAKEDADIRNESSCVTVHVEYIFKTADEYKYTRTAEGTTCFATTGVPGDTNGDGKVTLIDLSNVIDYFGVQRGDTLWAKARFFDFNQNGAIDINDITHVAKLIA